MVRGEAGCWALKSHSARMLNYSANGLGEGKGKKNSLGSGLGSRKCWGWIHWGKGVGFWMNWIFLGGVLVKDKGVELWVRDVILLQILQTNFNPFADIKSYNFVHYCTILVIVQQYSIIIFLNFFFISEYLSDKWSPCCRNNSLTTCVIRKSAIGSM